MLDLNRSAARTASGGAWSGVTQWGGGGGQRGTYLLLILDLPPGQRAVDELDHHVEQGPEVVLPAHLLPGDTGRRQMPGLR